MLYILSLVQMKKEFQSQEIFGSHLVHHQEKGLVRRKEDRLMKVPNWKHHSKKEQKRTLKPQALRQAKARTKALKRKLKGAFFNVGICT